MTLALASSSHASQPRHAHDSLVLGVVTAGTRRIETAGKPTLVPQGAVFVLAPGQAHACSPVEPDANSDAKANAKFNDNSDDKPGSKPVGKARPDAGSAPQGQAPSDDKFNDESDDKSDAESSPHTPACSYLALSITAEVLPPELSSWRQASPRLDDPALAKALVRLAEALSAPTGLLERQSLLAECLERLAGHCCAPSRQEPQDAGLTGTAKVSEMAKVSKVVGQARRLIEENLEAGVDLAGLAAACGVGMFALHRAFTRVIGLPPHAFQTHLRLRRAKELLRGGASLIEAALQSGFCDQAHMTRHFARAVGLSPAQYAQAHRQKNS
ncbi:MAG: hypothetical protein A2051_02725 [Desulfovibrionales bacterium GWA2_65_9]|nr:MAG: hypothetical protein A2051_02725 [Desulfovibrionales bacterium GWA2_65_9]